MLVLAFFGLHTSFFVPVVVIVSLLGLPIVAKHYECDWDPLAGRMPWEAGFKQLCASFPVLHGAPPIAYFCDVEGAAGYGDYIVAGWGTRDGELEFGPPPCNTSPHLAYGAPHGICRSRSWLVCDGIPELFKEKQPTCFGLFKYDDCNFRAKYDEPPDYVTVWYKTDGS